MKFVFRPFIVLLGIFLAGFFFPLSAAAAEYTNGAIRLVLDERTGRFSLYALDENNQTKGQALFAVEDPRTSFLSVIVNDRSYKLGDSSAFRIRLGGGTQNPSLIFESSFMIVTEEFAFIKDDNATAAKGVAITITLENSGDRQISAGARFLLDTSLSEKSRALGFTTNLRTISTETLLTRAGGDQWWTDKNDKLSLVGSLNTGAAGDPDSVFFANWKKLNDVSWKAVYQPGRNFNVLPYSVGDTAVCYYFDPRPLDRGEKRRFGFYLAVTTDIGTRAQDLVALRQLMARIDTLMASGSAAGDELAALESDLNKLRAKYSSGTEPR